MFTARYRFPSFAFFAAAAALVGASGQSAHAQTPLPNGATVLIPQTEFFGGTLLSTASSVFSTTNGGNTLSGTLNSAVYQTGGTGGALDFYYQIVLSPINNTNLTSFSLTSFSGFSLAVGQTTTDIDGAGTLFSSGTSALFSANRSGVINNGGTLTFSFDDPNTSVAFNMGTSETVAVRTNATNFTDTGGAGFLGGGVGTSGMGPVLVAFPAGDANTPEPGSLALLGTGLMGIGGVTIRRRKAKKSA